MRRTEEAPGDEGRVRERVGTNIWRVLDTPIIDLSSSWFSRVRPPGVQRDARSVAGRAPPTSRQSTFMPLVPDISLDSTTGVDPTAAEAQRTFSIATCVRRSMAWAWRAGPGYLLVKLASAGISAVTPYAIGLAGARVVDSLVQISQGATSNGEPLKWFAATVGLSFVAMASGLAARFADSHHRVRKNQAVMTDMRAALTGFSPVEQFSPEVTQLVNRTLHSQWALQSFGEKLFELVVPVVSAVSAVALIAPFSPVAACLLGVFAVPYFYHSRKRGLEELRISEQLADAQNRFGAREWTLLTGLAHLEIRMHGKTQNLLDHLHEERKRIDEAHLLPELNQHKREAWIEPLNTLAVAGIGLAILENVALHARHPELAGLSIGDYGLLTGALFSLNGSIRAFAWSIGAMLRSLPQAQLALAVMAKGLSRKKEILSRLELNAAPEIEIANLRFHYPPPQGEQPRDVLRQVTFKVKPGEMLGIVGESGSGKSSLVNLLCGIYDPISGSIKFNGCDIAQVSRESLWASSAYLRQARTNLWSMTLRENIMVGSPRPLLDEEIMALAEKVGFAEVMRSNQLTLDTVLGQWFNRGKSLSGGEEALLAMTRQAAVGANFLVLDEPTAGLDQRRADAVLSGLRGLNEATRIVISHDYGIAARADRIVVLAAGEIADIGTHFELLNRCALYRTACERQQNRLPMPNNS